MVIDRPVIDTEHRRRRSTSKIIRRVSIGRRSSSLRKNDIPRRRTRIKSLPRPSPRPPTIRKSLLHNQILQTQLRVTHPTQESTENRKLNSEFLSFELRTGAFSAFIDRLTPTTQIMIVIADPTIGNPPFSSWEVDK
jgi:hypothetical protein